MATIRKTVMVGFGLIQFPVGVQSAVQSTDVSLSSVCTNGHDPVAVKAPKSCPTCEATDGFVKGRKQDKQLVVLTDEDLEALKPPADVTTEMHFTVHRSEEVAKLTRSHGSLYYLAPHPGASTYNVVRDIVADSPDLAFLTEWAPRTSPGLYQLVVLNDRLALSGLAWPQSLLAAPEGVDDSSNHAQLLSLSLQFFEQQVTPFRPDTYRNQRADLLAEIVANAEGTPIVSSTKPAKASAEDALLAALQASVKQAS